MWPHFRRPLRELDLLVAVSFRSISSHTNARMRSLRPEAVVQDQQKRAQTTKANRIEVVDDESSDCRSSSVGAKPFGGRVTHGEMLRRTTIIRRAAPKHSYSLSPLIESSYTLRRLVDLGVDLAGLEEAPGVGNMLMALDWRNDVVPRLKLLITHAALDQERLAAFVTGNPWILNQDIDALQQRVTYLESKGFSKTAIARVITAARYWLNSDIKVVDSRLGWIQTQFDLDADQLRFVVTKNPKLITLGTGHIQLLQFSFQEEMGFTKAELKTLLLTEPFLFTTYKEVMRQTFDFIHNTLLIPHNRILQYPRVLRCYSTQLQARHEFLQTRSLAQYDPEKPNFVSLHSLSSGSDEEFCKNVAKCSVSEFNKHLKHAL